MENGPQHPSGPIDLLSDSMPDGYCRLLHDRLAGLIDADCDHEATGAIG